MIPTEPFLHSLIETNSPSSFMHLQVRDITAQTLQRDLNSLTNGMGVTSRSSGRRRRRKKSSHVIYATFFLLNKRTVFTNKQLSAVAGQLTGRQTDGRTNRVTYRVECTRQTIYLSSYIFFPHLLSLYPEEKYFESNTKKETT